MPRIKTQNLKHSETNQIASIMSRFTRNFMEELVK